MSTYIRKSTPEDFEHADIRAIDFKVFLKLAEYKVVTKSFVLVDYQTKKILDISDSKYYLSKRRHNYEKRTRKHHSR